MRLTQEQFDAIAPYEKHFETTIRSKWARHPGDSALDLMNTIYVQVTGVKQKLNKGCSHCIMQLLEDLGRIYFADKEERARVAVQESHQEDESPVKVEVKTEAKPKRKYTRKPKSE